MVKFIRHVWISECLGKKGANCYYSTTRSSSNSFWVGYELWFEYRVIENPWVPVPGGNTRCEIGWGILPLSKKRFQKDISLFLDCSIKRDFDGAGAGCGVPQRKVMVTDLLYLPPIPSLQIQIQIKPHTQMKIAYKTNKTMIQTQIQSRRNM